jgi:hypothetical protein
LIVGRDNDSFCTLYFLSQVRLVDQEKINEFGRLNNRLLEIRADVVQSKADAEKLDDATAEMMMNGDGKIMLLIGDSFVEVGEEYATECKCWPSSVLCFYCHYLMD